MHVVAQYIPCASVLVSIIALVYILFLRFVWLPSGFRLIELRTSSRVSSSRNLCVQQVVSYPDGENSEHKHSSVPVAIGRCKVACHRRYCNTPAQKRLNQKLLFVCFQSLFISSYWPPLRSNGQCRLVMNASRAELIIMQGRRIATRLSEVRIGVYSFRLTSQDKCRNEYSKVSLPLFCIYKQTWTHA